MTPSLPDTLRQKQRWLTPESLNLAPDLAGQPLGTPWRRALAMGVDLAVVGLLTGVSGAWLWAGLALVLLQLRNRPRFAPASRRQWVGWVAAAFIAWLALEEAGNQWREWREPTAAAAVQAAAAPDDDEPDSAATAAWAAASAAASGPALAASAAASSASAPTDAERIASLQARLQAAEKEARDAQRALAERPTGLREQVSHFLDELGAGLGWGIVYFSLLPAWWGGQTVGKKLLRLRVVELTGKPITVMRSLKRYGGYAAGLATGGLGFLQVLWDPNHQGLHDKAAHTAVLDLRPGREPAPLPVAKPTEPEGAAPAAQTRA
ncbi:RDD family protein [Rubrivivax rivuli]|uniref:RDD family protein n=1 Tax=Rubrivivax rivuli TaxID=1862385 RepID=A0A437RCI6_9BURK|nr:RDD family protein [Rubrivivax rivuli]RVU44500.1 RDD family protein [Rubrivivax rivuli]